MPVILLTVVFLILSAPDMAWEPPVLPPPPKLTIAPPLTEPVPDYELMLTKRELLWEIFTPEVIGQHWIADFKALKDAATSRLVEIPDDVEIGFVLRKQWKGPNMGPIAEKETDPSRIKFYYRLDRSAAGLLYELRDYLREVDGDNYVPFEITSLVRTWEYQEKLAKTNSNAQTIAQRVPASHVMGLAFDVSRLGMSPLRERNIEEFVRERSMDKKLISFKEGGQLTYHFIVRPEAHAYYEAYYVKGSTN